MPWSAFVKFVPALDGSARTTSASRPFGAPNAPHAKGTSSRSSQSPVIFIEPWSPKALRVDTVPSKIFLQVEIKLNAGKRRIMKVGKA